MLNEIRPAQARVIRLAKMEGYSIDGESRVPRKSVALVKVNIHRGAKRLMAPVRSVSDEDDSFIKRVSDDLQPVRP